MASHRVGHDQATKQQYPIYIFFFFILLYLTLQYCIGFATNLYFRRLILAVLLRLDLGEK